VEKDDVISLAVRRIKKDGRRVVAMNAASAYQAGGGFSTGGRHALEEAMCVQSTLYPALLEAVAAAKKAKLSVPEWADPPKAPGGKPWELHIPDDGALLCPHVEVFRRGTDCGYAFEEVPAMLDAVVAVAMPNANPEVRDSPVDRNPDPAGYEEQLSQKWRAALAPAAHCTEADCLVVPVAGCGVFSNSATAVGRVFGHVLREEFDGRFAEVVLAVPGGADDEAFAAAACGLRSLHS